MVSDAARRAQQERALNSAISLAAQDTLSDIQRQTECVRAKKIRQAACCGATTCLGYTIWQWLYGTGPELCLSSTFSTLLGCIFVAGECIDDKPNPRLPISLPELQAEEESFGHLYQHFRNMELSDESDDEQIDDDQILVHRSIIRHSTNGG
jgi:hypothetical protein